MAGTQTLDQNAASVALDTSKIPNLNIAALFDGDKVARAELVEEIRRACHSPGFFYVHGTNVADDVIESALRVSQDFFATPDEGPLKQNVHNRLAGGMKGWGPIFGEPSYQKNTVSHVESFDLGQSLTLRQCEELGISANIWPDLPGFQAAVEAYSDAVTRLGRAISEVISELLEMPADFINRNSGPSAPRTMRLLHYPENTAPDDGKNVGIAAHTDFECFTIMNQTAAGLELTVSQGQWCQAPSDIGTFTIILGDMTEHLSNGKFKATGHRVVNTPWTRYSLILFFALDEEFEVSPLPQFITSDNPASYEPVKQGAHIAAELARASANASNHGST
ncbi:MAG: isopenicillin N synthase family dioxygenase [Halioglobus sp.]